MKLTPLALVLAAGMVGACVDTHADDCKLAKTCPSSGDGDGDGDGDTGGTGGDGDGDGDTGGGRSSACDTECEGDTPVCNADQECVECTEDDSSACTGETLLCDTDSETCVQCLGSDDCSETAPLCDGGSCSGCESNLDCERFTDAPVCDQESGACVGCLSADDCEGNVCDPSANTCTEFEAEELFACEECVHDAQCQEGQVCVEQTFPQMGGEVVGNYCMWLKKGREETETACFPAGKPFIEPLTVTTTDGASAQICALRSTTCPAFLQHSQTVTGCDDTSVASDGACGAVGFDDGICELKEATPLCTYPCGSSEDCSGSFTCVGAPDGYCSL